MKTFPLWVMLALLAGCSQPQPRPDVVRDREIPADAANR